MWEKYADQVTFLVVYIREAHPEDGWVLNINRESDIAFADPENDAQRQEAAASCAINLKIRMPVVVDEVYDKIASAYGALPDRLYLIGTDGRVAFQGEPGPWGFDPAKLAAAIEAVVA
jgi:hypothetical protein